MRREGGVILFDGATQTHTAWLIQLPTMHPYRPSRKLVHSQDKCNIQVARANRARIVQGRASNAQEVFMEPEATYVGVDVAKV